MGLIRFIARGFINFFGITQPTPQQESRAAWFILAMLALIVVLAAAIFAMLVLLVGR